MTDSLLRMGFLFSFSEGLSPAPPPRGMKPRGAPSHEPSLPSVAARRPVGRLAKSAELLFALALPVAASTALSGCEEDSPIERAGERIEDATDDSRIERAGERVEDATDEVGE